MKKIEIYKPNITIYASNLFNILFGKYREHTIKNKFGKTHCGRLYVNKR